MSGVRFLVNVWDAGGSGKKEMGSFAEEDMFLRRNEVAGSLQGLQLSIRRVIVRLLEVHAACSRIMRHVHQTVWNSRSSSHLFNRDDHSRQCASCCTA